MRRIKDALRWKCMALLLCCCASLHAQQPSARVNWLSFEELSQALTAEPKPVLITFYTDWCVYCKKMEREVFTNPEVVRQLNETYYAVRFDAESVGEVRFDGQVLTNPSQSKQKQYGKFHQLALLLGTRDGKFVPPVTLLLNKDFVVEEAFFEYVSSKQLLEALR